MYNYFARKYPTPGTGNYAFQTGNTLPVLQAQGPGIFAKGSLRVTQLGNLMVQSTVIKTDFTNGGYVAGQFIGQPLSQAPSS